jgi:YVTN family beta-propeller protein
VPGTVSVIDAIRHVQIRTITVGLLPTGVAVTPDGRLVYVANYGSKSVSVISTLSDRVVATIGVGLAPDGVTISPDGRQAYVANLGSSSVSVIDVASNAVVSTIDTGGVAPRDIAFTPDGAFAYVTHIFSTDIAVIDTAAHAVVDRVQTGVNTDGIAHRPDAPEVYAVSNPTTPAGAPVTIVDTITNTVVTQTAVGRLLFDIAFSNDGSLAYISGENVYVLDVATTSVVATILAGGRTVGIAVRPVLPQINNSVSLAVDGTSCCANAQFGITATFTNISGRAIGLPFFEVVSLTGDNLLDNADHAPGGVGATLTPDVGDDAVLSPGESRTVTFAIRLATRKPFEFFVNVRGQPR